MALTTSSGTVDTRLILAGSRAAPLEALNGQESVVRGRRYQSFA